MPNRPNSRSKNLPKLTDVKWNKWQCDFLLCLSVLLFPQQKCVPFALNSTVLGFGRELWSHLKNKIFLNCLVYFYFSILSGSLWSELKLTLQLYICDVTDDGRLQRANAAFDGNCELGTSDPFLSDFLKISDKVTFCKVYFWLICFFCLLMYITAFEERLGNIFLILIRL